MNSRQIIDDRDLPISLDSKLDDYGLDPYEFRIYVRIARRASLGQAWESESNMAIACRMSVDKVKHSLQTLIAHNLIHRESRSGATVIYRLTSSKSWLPPIQVEQKTKDVEADTEALGSSSLYKANQSDPRKLTSTSTNFESGFVEDDSLADLEPEALPTSTTSVSDSATVSTQDLINQVRDKNYAPVAGDSLEKFPLTGSTENQRPMSTNPDRQIAGALVGPPNWSAVTPAEIHEMQLAMGRLPPYRFKRGPNGIHPDFIEYIRQWMLSWSKREVPTSDARSYITKREPGGPVQTEWSTILAKAEEWQESLQQEDKPTEGQMLASEVAIALNSPYSGAVNNRFEQVAGKYKWEIAPGEPIPEIVEWYTNKIQYSKRPEMTGKPAAVLARQDMSDRYLAAAIYEEWEKWAKSVLKTHEFKVQSFTPKNEPKGVTQTVDVPSKPAVRATDALLPSDPVERRQKLQEIYNSSAIHKVIVRGWLKDNPDWNLEIVEHQIREIQF